MQHLSFGQALTLVANGNYQLATNWIVAISSLVKARYAAAVTTYIPFVIAVYCCVLIARFMAARSCGRPSIAVACGLFALQVSGYEVFLNATNVQWVCSVITLFLFLEEEAPAASLATVGRCASVAALGMTGVTSCILLPVAAVATLVRRSRGHAVMLLVLAATTLVQLAIIAMHPGNAGRSYSLSLFSLVPLALQGVFSGFLPATSLDAIGGALAEHDRFTPAVGFQIVLVGSCGLAAVAASAVDTLGRFRTGILLLTVVFATLTNEFGALGSVGDFMSSYGGSRYFFLASTCMIVMLAAGLNSESAWRRRASALAVVAFASNVALTALASPLPSVFFKGRSFAAQVDACAAGTSCSVYAWPQADWTRFDIDADRLH